MANEVELLTEIRDLLLVIAEPQLAERDERLRAALAEIVGKSRQKAEAVSLMDGTRTQADIHNACGIDKGQLSRLTKSLREAGLVGPGDDRPKIAFPIPSNFADTVAGQR